MIELGQFLDDLLSRLPEKHPQRAAIQKHVELLERQREYSVVVAAEGSESTFTIDGATHRGIPIVGADKDTDSAAQVGVGLILPDEGTVRIWGLWGPRRVIQSWRAMKFLEKVDRISDGTLEDVWYAAGREISPLDEKRVARLASEMGEDRFNEVRESVLAQTPDKVELDAILTAFSKKGIGVSKGEVKEELEAGRINPTPIVEAFLVEEPAA